MDETYKLAGILLCISFKITTYLVTYYVAVSLKRSS